MGFRIFARKPDQAGTNIRARIDDEGLLSLGHHRPIHCPQSLAALEAQDIILTIDEMLFQHAAIRDRSAMMDPDLTYRCRNVKMAQMPNLISVENSPPLQRHAKTLDDADLSASAPYGRPMLV
jgi:hypothetical protein